MKWIKDKLPKSKNEILLSFVLIAQVINVTFNYQIYWFLSPFFKIVAVVIVCLILGLIGRYLYNNK